MSRRISLELSAELVAQIEEVAAYLKITPSALASLLLEGSTYLKRVRLPARDFSNPSGSTNPRR